VNGKTPRDMTDFVARMEASSGTVELRTSSDGVIVLDTRLAREATRRILDRYRIVHDRSPDLLARTEGAQVEGARVAKVAAAPAR
jgi:hypothetical protein